MAATPESALDWPVDDIPDGMAVIRAALQWHFDPNTGSPFWLARAATLTDAKDTDDKKQINEEALKLQVEAALLLSAP